MVAIDFIEIDAQFVGISERINSVKTVLRRTCMKKSYNNWLPCLVVGLDYTDICLERSSWEFFIHAHADFLELVGLLI